MKQLSVKLKDPREFEAISRTPLGYESLNLGKSSDEKKTETKCRGIVPGRWILHKFPIPTFCSDSAHSFDSIPKSVSNIGLSSQLKYSIMNMPNSAFMGTDEEGLPSPTLLGEDCFYHIQGLLTAASIPGVNPG
jgi:hypothetical protein